MEHKVTKDHKYLVSTKAETTVTDPESGWSRVIPANTQTIVVALSDKFTIEGDCIIRPFADALTFGGGSDGGVTISFDTTPTSGSTNAVTSGGLYNLLRGSKLTLGVDANASHYGVALGQGASATGWGGIAIGYKSAANGVRSVAVGSGASATKECAMALGDLTSVKDIGAAAIGVWDTVNHGTQTILYLIGDSTPLANTYENGEACLGYVVKDNSGNISACGTRKLSELLTNNTAFAPAALDLDAPAPTPFLPTGITDPIEIPEELEQ